MRIYGFQGIRFTGAAQEAGAMAAPPYDQIDDARRDELHETKHQFAHLSRPKGDTVDAGHDAAAVTHSAWIASGVLDTADEPTVYPYEIVLPDGAVRLGISVVVGVEPENSTVIRRHEHTIAKHVDERLALLERMQIDLEPILLLSEDSGTLEPQLAIDIAELEPVAEHRDEFGNLHKLYELSGVEHVSTYKSVFENCPGLIADGHHRYKGVAGSTAAQTGSRGRRRSCRQARRDHEPLSSPTLAIDPIHRGLKGDFDLSSITPATRTPWSGASASDFAEAVAAAPAPALGVWTREDREIWHLDVSGPIPLPGRRFGHDRPRTPRADSPSPRTQRRERDRRHRALPLGRGQASRRDRDGRPQHRPLPALRCLRSSSRPPCRRAMCFPRSPPGFSPRVVSGLVWSPHDGMLL